MRYCKECDRETEHQDYKNAIGETVGWECEECGRTGHWQSVAALKTEWIRSLRREVGHHLGTYPRSGEFTDWLPEDDTGMEDHFDELIIFRLQWEVEYWRSRYERLDAQNAKYKSFIEVAQEIFNK